MTKSRRDSKTLEEPLHYDASPRVAHTHAEIRYQGKQSGKNEIFEAKNQVVKFVAYDINQLLKRLKRRGFNPLTNHLIWLYFPIIVFDGRLYEGVLKDGAPRLSEQKHVLLATPYSPAYVNDFAETESPDL